MTSAQDSSRTAAGELPGPVVIGGSVVIAGAPEIRTRGLRSAAWRLALITLVVVASLFYSLQVTKAPSGLYDFRGGLYNAGTAILHGRSPYQPRFLAAQAAIMRGGGIAIGESVKHAFSVPLYPAPANLAVVPVSLLPYWLAATLFTLLSIGAMILGLRLLGVRDWRCIGVALVSWPSLFSLDLGALGPLLVLGFAVAWLWRDRLWPPAIAVAAVVVTKLFPWPLAIWLLVTRRFRALALTVLIGVVTMFGAWAVIGFAGMAQYPQMLSDATFIQQGRASSLVAALLAFGLSAGTAHLLAFVVAGALLALAWHFSKRPDGDRKVFGLALIAALTASPIVWDHYMVLLFVPIALTSPTLSPIWFVPLSTPILLVIMVAFFPLPHGTGPTNVASQRASVLWVILEAMIVARLCWPEAVQRWERRLAGWRSRGLRRRGEAAVASRGATGGLVGDGAGLG